MHIIRRGLTDRSKYIFFSIVLITALLLEAVPSAFGLTPYLGRRSDMLSSSTVNAVASHVISFEYKDTTTAVASLRFQFCANSPIPEDTCVAPAGFNATAVNLANQTGETGFSIASGSSNSNNVVLTRVAQVPAGGLASYTLANVTNPSNSGTYYLRIRTYNSSDGTGLPIEEGGAVFVMLPGLNINTEVPPYIRFCVAVIVVSLDCSTATNFFINLGDFTPSQTSSGSSQFVVATNAESGYNVTINGTTLTSGNNIIPALAQPTVATPGTSQFGINLRANSVPSVGSDVVGPGTAQVAAGYNQPNLYKFHSGDVVASSATSNDNRKFTVSYIASVDTNQPPGYYVTTILYICLANF